MELTKNQIEQMERKGFKYWTSGDKERLYINPWQIDGVQTNWKKTGKKTVSIDGEELSYTKSALFGPYGAKSYVDVKTGEVVTDVSDYQIASFIKRKIQSMIPPR